jgi:hypothetical protein
MKTFLKNLLNFFFGKLKNNKGLIVGNSVPLVTEEEAYIPFRSEAFDKYFLSRSVNLNDPIEASVKIRRNFKSTPDTAVLKGNIDTKRSLKIKAATNVVIANLKDLKIRDCNLTIESSFANTFVVINVSNSLSLTRGRIVLKGIDPENVLFNYTGPFGPSLMTDSTLVGTVVTLTKMSILRGCTLLGETLGSEPVISNGKMVNKTTENMEKLQAERQKEAEEAKYVIKQKDTV